LTFYYRSSSFFLSLVWIILYLRLDLVDIYVFYILMVRVFFFIILFLHLFKGFYFASFRILGVWGVGIIILLLLMLVAFMGYVLVWAQIRYWASVVITSLLRVIPKYGDLLVSLIWGGFMVSDLTLKFFFSFHFLLPWLILFLVLLHLLFLHFSGRSSMLIEHNNFFKINFFPVYWGKDSYNFFVFLLFIFLCLVFPFILGDPEIFLESNSMVSPVHIIPEWYFLFAYAILRAIPNKMLGVLALLMRILIFFLFLFKNNYYTILDFFS